MGQANEDDKKFLPSLFSHVSKTDPLDLFGGGGGVDSTHLFKELHFQGYIREWSRGLRNWAISLNAKKNLQTEESG